MLPEMNTILFATGLGPNAPKVFSYALSLAERYGGEVTVVNAIEPMNPTGRAMIDTILAAGQADEMRRKTEHEVHELLSMRLEEFCAKHAKSRSHISEVRVTEGRPEEAILRVADEISADVIVMGSHAHSKVSDIILGSTAQRVMQRSTIPVLLVRV
jgi:nucleotide-binding universal stress UspA family protein